MREEVVPNCVIRKKKGEKMYRKIGVFLFIFTWSLFMGSHARAVEGPFVSEPVTPHSFDGDLRTLPVATEWVQGDARIESPILGGIVTPVGDVEEQVSEPLVQDIADPTAMPAPIENFGGIGYTGVAPPDPNGDVGPSNYIQMVNSKFAIYDKTGVLLAGPSNINTLWAGFGGNCEFSNNGDPIVLYDHLANRWLLSQFVAFTNQCIAISKTSDPVAGGWWLYDFSTGGGTNHHTQFG